MRVLVVGSGGREHALCWALAASPLLDKLWCAPGNPGTAELALNVPIPVSDIAGLVAFAQDNDVDLVLPGPEAPLVAGLADALEVAAIPCCGPTASAARLEGSKSFAKEICDAAGIPTARWERFDDAEAARRFVRRRGGPLVIKADGLAAGKGVVLAATTDEALAAIGTLMEDRSLGEAGATILIEEYLDGEEVSLFALSDGRHALFFGAAQDHKRVGEGDTGPNTGGMGAYAPPPVFTESMAADAMRRIVNPAITEMARRGTPFRGVLFAGLMLTQSGPQLIEFNARLGDPECQALMPRLMSDLLAALVAACDGELANFHLRWHQAPSIAVVLAAQGYPGEPVRGGEIKGLDRAASVPGVLIFHAGTERAADGRLLAAGGRVLTVNATAPTLGEARDRAYAAVAKIDWPDGFCRSDIGWRALRGPA
ncbi:MAG: phosphoribosylamine--glycine ligase [Alphaproteobacteria bacterium]|nr:phosphoribosylamine--glycine ligase [Alphaproteobacteria bacterium]